MARSNLSQTNPLRAAITEAYRRPETECLPSLLAEADQPAPAKETTQILAQDLATALRSKKNNARWGVDTLLQEFSLSSQEGIALMCLAEALLRIPDAATRDAMIRDKLARADWQSHLKKNNALFVNAATWGLFITGKLVAASSDVTLTSSLTGLMGRWGEPLIRKAVIMALRMMGEQFVLGQSIEEALANSRQRPGAGLPL